MKWLDEKLTVCHRTGEKLRTCEVRDTVLSVAHRDRIKELFLTAEVGNYLFFQAT